MPFKLCIASVAVATVLHPSEGDAQIESFMQAVAQLAHAASEPEASRSQAITAAADHMTDALAEWDARIAAQEAAAADKQDGSAGSYKRHTELGVAYCLRGRFNDALREFDAA